MRQTEPSHSCQPYRRGGSRRYVACAYTDGVAWLRDAVRRGFAGNFLDAERTPWHDCAASHLLHFSHGLVSEVALRKCCPIGLSVLPGAAPDPAARSCAQSNTP